jgi:hypothetical protein
MRITLVASDVIDTAYHQKSQFYNRISLEIRSHMQKTLIRGSGVQMELLYEKNGGSQSI